MANDGALISSSEGMLSLPVIEQLGQRFGMTAKAFAYTFRAVAMPQPHTEAEFVSCCLVAREHGLNPLTKEIYFMRVKGGAIQPIVSVDGWTKKCNENANFDGMEFAEIADDKGALVAITCIIYRKDRNHPVKVTEHLDECKRAGGPVWNTSPRRMLRHRALTQCARYAFGFAGIMDRDEFEQWQQMRDVTPARQQKAAPLPADDIPDVPMEPDKKPDTILDEIPEIPQDEPDTLADSAGFLEKLRADLNGETDEAIRTEIWESNLDIIERLSDADQRIAQKIYEGRQ